MMIDIPFNGVLATDVVMSLKHRRYEKAGWIMKTCFSQKHFKFQSYFHFKGLQMDPYFIV